PITDDDFVEIDSLLASAQQQEQDSERFNQLNVDVGLDDYADIIGEHERRDVDQEDNGYSAKLDLVRAYIEIDDHESAQLILDDILSSDAPEHIKTEAQSLRQ
ncbi:MAG: FimV/HubP family polar landmark protein, partial [Rheinheimera sp.]|nr:FimV/HubP family polar landmark protein [Rheinheimera sp.]